MKKKLKDITIEDFCKVCMTQEDCFHCPLEPYCQKCPYYIQANNKLEKEIDL